MAKQNRPWEPEELAKKLTDLTNEGKIRWIGAGWGFLAFIMTGSIPNDLVIDLEHKGGDPSSEIPYIPPTAEIYALYVRGAVSSNLLFWNNETNLIKPLWMAADKTIQPKRASHQLRGKTYGEINRDWPNSEECATLQKTLKNL